MELEIQKALWDIMGIKIKDLARKGIKKVKFKKFYEKRIAIDAFNQIYRFLGAIRRKDGSLLRDNKGNITSHLSGLFFKIINYFERKIYPIYVFDGPSPNLKLFTIQKRKKMRNEAEEKMEKALNQGDLKNARKYAQMTSSLKADMIKESMKLIEFFGIPTIQAKSEGEAQAAYLVNNDEAWAVSSQDYDTLLFGGKRLIKDFKLTKKINYNDNSVIPIYFLEKMLDSLGITLEQLIDIAVLIGSDYHKGIKGIGEHTALNLIQKYDSIKTILNQDLTVRGKEIQMDLEITQKIKNIFLDPELNKNYDKIEFKKIEFDKIKNFMIEKHNFSDKRIKKGLKRVKKIK